METTTTPNTVQPAGLSVEEIVYRSINDLPPNILGTFGGAEEAAESLQRTLKKLRPAVADQFRFAADLSRLSDRPVVRVFRNDKVKAVLACGYGGRTEQLDAHAAI